MMHFTPLIFTHVPLIQFYEFFLSLLRKQTGKRKKKTTTSNKIKDNYKKAQPTQTKVHANKKHKNTNSKTII